jgi:hypothetical protein
MKKVWSMFMLLAVCLVACTNIDDLEDDVDALKKRVTALETQVRDINSNTEALRELYNEGTFITNIEEKSDSYTLTLSNGKTVNLYMKNDNNLLCPIIGIDSEGYWTVLYNKNETPERLTVNGQPVKANGESGKTPTFNVDSEGYWQVSYDGGKNYSYIYKEGTTDKVSATGDGSAPAEDKNFKSVTVENNELVLVLAGEDAPTIRIPIVRDFECSFAAEDLEQIQEFSAGETKEFTMAMRGVENTMITAPEGWSAKFSKEAGKENVLVVTAPASSAKIMTRATADNSTDIAVLATNGKYAMIAKIQVSIKNRTDYKAMFESGELQIGEETLNPENYTSKVIDSNTTSDISSELGASEGTILFLTGTGTFTISSNKAISAPIIIVGQYPDERPNLEFGETAYLSLKSGKLLLKNINIKARAANYLFNSPASGDATFTNLTIEDCKMTNITKAMYYVSATTVGIGNITFKNSLFEFVNTGNIAFFNTTKTAKPSIFGKLVLENNIIYHKTSVSPIQIFNWAIETSTTDEGTMTVNIKNNSFINIKGSYIFIKANKANINYTNNIFCVSSESTLTSYLYELKDAGSTVNTTDNILYDAKVNWNYANSDVCKPANNTLSKESTIPFTEIDCINGVFTKDPAYINNGATIE